MNQYIPTDKEYIKYINFTYQVFEWLKTTELLNNIPPESLTLRIKSDTQYIPNGSFPVLFGGSLPGSIELHLMNIIKSNKIECILQDVEDLADNIVKNQIIEVLIHECFHLYKFNNVYAYRQDPTYYR